MQAPRQEIAVDAAFSRCGLQVKGNRPDMLAGACDKNYEHQPGLQIKVFQWVCLLLVPPIRRGRHVHAHHFAVQVDDDAKAQHAQPLLRVRR